MKNLIIYTAALLLIITSCATTGGLAKEKVDALLQSKTFTFMAERANPTNYDVINVMNSLPASSSSRMLNLDYGYIVQLKGSELMVELPYFGRMYTPSYDTSKNSYRFTSKDYTLNEQEGKKGSTIYTLVPKDEPNIRKIIMEIFPNGKAVVSVDANDRQPISYDGYIMANDKPRK